MGGEEREGGERGNKARVCIPLLHWTRMGCFSKEEGGGVVMESGERLQAGRNFSI